VIIFDKLRGVNRIVNNISRKPAAIIEWEQARLQIAD
jgi:GMP synthase PP-ATPase subunit